MKTLAELPVSVRRRTHESAAGWLLRTGSANGMSVSQLLGFLGAGGRRYIDIRSAALWVGIEEGDDLESGGGDTIRYLGQLFWPPYLLRLKRPQICVACVNESGFCHAVWELCCFAVCPIHQRALVDACRSCGRRLRWFRPAVDVCDCGAYLEEHSASAPHTDMVWFASEILTRSGSAGRLPHEEDCPFAGSFAWWRAVSLGGLMRILLAFGAQTGATPPNCGSLYRLSTADWAELVCRSLKRLCLLSGSASPANEERQSLRGLVWEGALESIVLRHNSSCDRDAALALHQSIFGEVPGARLRRCQKDRRQLELFGVPQ